MREATAALRVAQPEGLPLAIVDAIDLLTAVAERRGDDVAASLRDAADAERRRVGYRFPLMSTAPVGATDRSDQSDLVAVIARATRAQPG